MKKSDSLSLVRGPPARTINSKMYTATHLSQLTHSLCQLPTMGIEHYSLHTESLSVTGHEAMGRLSCDAGQHLTAQEGKTQTRIDRLKKGKQ